MLESARTKSAGSRRARRSHGFTYDIGGHVMFSHYKYYDKLFDKLMGDDYQLLMRECWVWMFDRFLPYPFQNNIRYLPEGSRLRVPARADRGAEAAARHVAVRELRGVHRRRVRRGIAKHFMMPYNFKVWAHPPR